MKEAVQKADILVQAIKYIKQFEHKIFVIKYGGNAMTNEALKASVFEDIALLWQLGLKIVIVHGGGPAIDAEIAKQGLQKKLIDGLRVTDQPTLEIVSNVLEEINEDCVEHLKVHGIRAKDYTEGTLKARIKDPRLGKVGEVTSVKIENLLTAFENDVIPIVSSIGRDESGELLNINADSVATKIAAALLAEKLTILTNVDSVLDSQGQRIAHLSVEQAQKLIDEGVITTGMIPKIKACMEAAEQGVGKAHLLNGMRPRTLLLEIFTDSGIGTEVVQ